MLIYWWYEAIQSPEYDQLSERLELRMSNRSRAVGVYLIFDKAIATATYLTESSLAGTLGFIFIFFTLDVRE